MNEVEKIKIELLTRALIVSYFREGDFEIHLFFGGNQNYLDNVNLDLKDIREGKSKRPKRTNAMSLERLHEANEIDFSKLLDIKFKNNENGFITIDRFAKAEAKDIELRYKEYFNWFPILGQWADWLKSGSINVPWKCNLKSFKDYFNIASTDTIEISLRALKSLKPKQFAEKLKSMQDEGIIKQEHIYPTEFCKAYYNYLGEPYNDNFRSGLAKALEKINK